MVERLKDLNPFIVHLFNFIMNRYQLELQSNLSELLTEDVALLNEVIEEFVTLLGNSNRMHDLHEYTSKEIENDWGRG